jgi:Cu2+-exporting ATPase
LTVATGALAARGVLVTRGHAIEALARADRFIFDKTGTLTLGRMTLVEVIPIRDDAARALALAAALERGSEHPIARALAAEAADAGAASAIAVDDLRATTGAGVEGMIEGRARRLGRPEFVAALHGTVIPPEVESIVGAGDTVIALGDAAGWQAFFRLSDGLRPEAAAMVARLAATGIKLSIFSGDAPRSAAGQHRNNSRRWRHGDCAGQREGLAGIFPPERWRPSRGRSDGDQARGRWHQVVDFQR